MAAAVQSQSQPLPPPAPKSRRNPTPPVPQPSPTPPRDHQHLVAAAAAAAKMTESSKFSPHHAAAAIQQQLLRSLPPPQPLPAHMLPFSPLLYPYQLAMAQAVGGKNPVASFVELQRQAADLQRQYLLDMIPAANVNSRHHSTSSWKPS